MNKRIKIFLYLINCFFLFVVGDSCLPSHAYAQSKKPIIDEIRVNGLHHINEQDFRNLLNFSKGDVFDAKEATESIQSIFKSTFFKNVSLSYLTNGLGNKILIYNVTEKLWVSSVEFSGNDAITSTTLKDKISNKKETFFNPYILKKDIKTITDLYLKEGYVGTQVKFTKELSKKYVNEVTLKVKIYEGGKLNIKKVSVSGTKILSPTFLKGHFQTLKEPSFFGLVKSPLIPEFFANEKKIMLYMANDQGFLDFKILGTSLDVNINYHQTIERFIKELRHFSFSSRDIKTYQKELSDLLNKKDLPGITSLIKQIEEQGLKTKVNKENFQLFIEGMKVEIQSLFDVKNILKNDSLPKDIDLSVHFTEEGTSGFNVTFYIKEGDQYVFLGTQLINSKKMDPNYIKKKYLLLSPGDIYSQQLFDQFQNNIMVHYRNQGYMSVVVQDTPIKDTVNHTIKHRLIIEQGKRMHIEKMFIEGNTKTKSFVIDRELRVKEGSIFSQQQLQTSDRLLQRTGYFESVDIQNEPGSEENLLNLKWKVKEAKTGSFQLGGGYGTETGFSIYGNYKESNFLGRGLTTSANVQYGQYNKGITLGVSSNYINYMPVNWSISTGYNWIRQQASPRYDRNQDGQWDKVVIKDGKYYLLEENDKDFNEYYDEDRTGNYTSSTSGWNTPVDFTPDDEDDIYSDDRYFDREVFSLNLGGGYSFYNFWNISLNHGTMLSKYENPHNIDLDHLYEDDYYRLKTDLESNEFSYSSSLGIYLSYNNTDSPVSPTQGVRSSISASLFGIEGGYDQFTKLMYSLDGYVPLASSKKLGWDLVWASGLTVGTITPFFNDKPHLHYENQFSFDAMTEVRGWSNYVYDSDLLGLGKVSFGTEIRSSIPKTSRMLWLIGFFDAGNMSDDPFSIPLNFADYLYSVGAGLRIDIPSFPVRFYLAQRLKWDTTFFTTTGGLTFEFAINSSF